MVTHTSTDFSASKISLFSKFDFAVMYAHNSAGPGAVFVSQNKTRCNAPFEFKWPASIR